MSDIDVLSDNESRFTGTYRDWQTIRKSKAKYDSSFSRNRKNALLDKIAVWNRRNDSSQVAQLLHPQLFSLPHISKKSPTSSRKHKRKRILIEIYSDSSSDDTMDSSYRKRSKVRPMVVSNRSYPTQSVQTSILTSPPKAPCEKCYCNYLKNIDTARRPSSSSSSHSLKGRYGNVEITKPSASNIVSEGSAISLKTLEHVREIIDYSPESKFLKKLRNKANLIPAQFECNKNCAGVRDPEQFKRNLVSGLEYTDRRELIENVYEKNTPSNMKKYDPHRYEDNGHYNKKDNVGSHSDIDRGLEIPEIENKRSRSRQTLFKKNLENTHSDKTKALNCDYIDRAKDFRKSNFFDCVSTTTLTDKIEIPLHTCVHKYELDERLFPKPLNPDEQDRSKCVICNIPMVTAVDNFVKTPGLGLENYELEYMKKRMALKEKLGSSFTEQEIELKVPLDSENYESVLIPEYSKNKPSKLAKKLKSNKLKFNVPPKVKKMAPVDSLALRYQKGIV